VAFASDPKQFEGLLRGVVVHVDRVLAEPLLRTSIAADPRLQDLAILRFAQHGVFKVPPHHAEALTQLI
jgi:hypothetical protein